MAKRQILSPTGGKYWVADEGDLSAAEQASQWWPRAPEPWRSKYAPRWFKAPLSQQDPWLAFPVSDDGTEDRKWDEYVKVVGELPQRVPFIRAGGKREHYVHAMSNYAQDFKLFQGIIDAPDTLKARIEAAAGEFTKYKMGVPGCYLTLSGNPQHGPGPVVNLYFQEAKLPPPASQERGIFQWVHEFAEHDFNATKIIGTYQKALIQGGIKPEVRHPSLQGWTQAG